MPEQALAILKQYWGYDSFRHPQQDIISSVLSGRDTLALLPTGAGKSLCYQVPALVQDGICLVISPLVALMQDQVSRLTELGISATYIQAGMHQAEVKLVLENCVHGAYKLLYVSPERLQTAVFLEYLPAMNISFLAVDEAHCVSQWGHDFRPDYLKISALRRVFRNIPLLAVTASATPQVKDDILLQLKMRRTAVFRQSFERKNIFARVHYSENKNTELIQRLKQREECCIIYCRSRKQTEILTRLLHQNGIKSVHYHAGMAREKRQEAQEAWMSAAVNIMVATTAFGMGIDRANVRRVIHYDAPEHLEAWYQESGRAGRDGQASEAILLYNGEDLKRLEESIEIKYPREAYLKQVYQSVAEYLQIPIGAEPYRYYDFDLVTFCKNFGLQALPASSALKLLEQEGLWTLSDAIFKPATVLITANRELLDQLTQHYPDLAMVLTTLLRLHGTIFQYPVAINTGAVAKRAKMRREQVEHALETLHRMEVLEYLKPKNGPQLFFHHYRVDSRHLIIDLQRIESLRARHRERTKAVVAFLQNSQTCRTRILLNYFGQSMNQNCGHCDVCAESTKTVANSRALGQKITQLLEARGKLSVQECLSSFPAGQRKDLLAVIRQMTDDRTIKLAADQTISLF